MKLKNYYSISKIINQIYITLVLLTIILTTILSFFISKSETYQNTNRHVDNTLKDKSQYLNDRMSQMFSEIWNLDNHPDFLKLLLHPNDDFDYMIGLDKELKSIQYQYQDILESIYLNVNDGNYIFYTTSKERLNPKFKQEIIWDKINESPNYYWENIHRDPIFLEESEVLSIYKKVGSPYSEVTGLIVFHLKRDFFDRYLMNTHITENGYLTLVSPDGNVYGGMGQNKKELSLCKKFSSQNNSSWVTHGYTLHKKNIPINGFKLIAIYPHGDLTRSKKSFIILNFLLSVIIISFLTIAMKTVKQRITSPINDFVNHISKLPNISNETNLKEKIPYELEILYTTHDELVKKNKELINTIQKEANEKKRLEVAVLQAQINPHFLYNTLYSIESLCSMEMHQEASTMTHALSEYFRIGLSKGKEVISLETELQHALSYLEIMEMRHGDYFTYQILVDNSIKQMNVVKLMLQPIIENAIYHGIRGKIAFGKIKIIGKDELENVRISIFDNGCGIPVEKVTKMEQELKQGCISDSTVTGIGLKSVFWRIKELYPQADMLIESEENQGTLVTILIPKESSEKCDTEIINC